MATIDELTPEQIRNPEIYQKIKDLGDSFVRRNQAKEAWSLQNKLNSLLKISNLQNFNPEMQKKYDNLLAALKWTAFPLLAEEDALLLLKNNYLSVLDNEDIDTHDRMEARMFTLDLFPRNELRQKMQKALKENSERLGNKTFGEWLMDYSKMYDFRERDEMTPQKFVRQDLRDAGLSEPEKNKLRKALQIFDKTLLVTPVMSEPLFSMAVMNMIKGGIIDKASIDPALLQTISITARTAVKTPAAPIAPAPMRPAPIPTPIRREEVREVKEIQEVREVKEKLEKEPIEKPQRPTGLFEKMFGEKQKEISTFPEELAEKEPVTEPAPQPAPLSPAQGGYRIRTMKQDIEKMKRQPIPPKPVPKIKDNIVDLSGK